MKANGHQAGPNRHWILALYQKRAYLAAMAYDLDMGDRARLTERFFGLTQVVHSQP